MFSIQTNNLRLHSHDYMINAFSMFMEQRTCVTVLFSCLACCADSAFYDMVGIIRIKDISVIPTLFMNYIYIMHTHTYIYMCVCACIYAYMYVCVCVILDSNIKC